MTSTGIDSPGLDDVRRRTALVSFLVGIVMLGVKGTAYLLTHSSAILSDALESVIHVAATGMALYSVIVSSRPPDPSHPYGHGKVEFISAGIEGGLITLAAFVIIRESISAIITGRVLLDLDTGVLLTLFAAVVSLLLGRFLIRRGRETSSLTLIADGKHVLTDSYTSFGVIAGLLLVRFTGIELIDPLVAIVVAANILISGYKLVRISIGGLMDESDRETIESTAGLIREIRSAEWISVHNLRVMRSGDFFNIDFHLTIPFYWSVRQGHDFETGVRNGIVGRMGGRANALVHLDPCTPLYCRLCRVSPCHARKQEHGADLQWSVAELTGDAPVYDPEESDTLHGHRRRND